MLIPCLFQNKYWKAPNDISVRFKTNKRDYFFMLKANKVWKSQSQNRASARAAGGSKLELEKWKKSPSKIICLEGGCFSGSL